MYLEGTIIYTPYVRIVFTSLLYILQAFLEMADESAASQMVAYFTTCTAQLRGRAVYVQFSNHKELKTDQTHSNSVSAAKIISRAPFRERIFINFFVPLYAARSKILYDAFRTCRYGIVTTMCTRTI